jgi:hypothetical protein
MMHSRRTHCFGPVDTPRHLAEKLTGSTWCLCTGFYLEGRPDYLFLNDSISEDSAVEFGIIKRTADGFTQVESTITRATGASDAAFSAQVTAFRLAFCTFFGDQMVTSCR